MIGALAGVHAPIEVEQHRFARRHVADALKIQRIQRHAFGGNHVLHAALGLAPAEHQRPDAVWVAEGH